jgi:hypothetical protein
MNAKLFRIEVGGFQNEFLSLAAVADWVADLKRTNPSVIGQTATVYQGEITPRGTMVFAAGCPRKQLTVSA